MAPEFGGYITFEREGEQVAGCMLSDGSGPSTWSVYLESNDAAATVAMAKANGGQVIVDAMQVGDFGHMAVVTDPSGAAVGIWQPLEMPGFATRNEDGAPAWFEVLSNDYDAALPFYANVFGWDIHPMSDDPGVPVLHARQGRVRPRRDHGRDRDAGGSAVVLELLHPGPGHRRRGREGVELGGSKLMGPDETPYGRLASIADPTGVPFMVMGSEPTAVAPADAARGRHTDMRTAAASLQPYDVAGAVASPAASARPSSPGTSGRTCGTATRWAAARAGSISSPTLPATCSRGSAAPPAPGRTRRAASSGVAPCPA